MGITARIMIQKYLLFICLVLSGLTAAKCQRELEPLVFDKTWLHANEEDEGEIKVYRPNTYNFPPSRGRTGFALEQNGTFRLYSIAPTDGLEEHTGHWELLKDNLLQVTFPDKENENFTLELMLVTAEIVKVRRVPSTK